MIKKYVVVIALFIGIVAGMARHELTMPVVSRPDSPFYHGVRGRNQVAITVNVDWGGKIPSGYVEDIT